MFTATSLSCVFPHKTLFCNLSFELSAGEVLHVTGQNGAGKSTLLEILAGIRKPTSGAVSYQGTKDLRSCAEYLPPEGNGLFLKLDSQTNLETWAALGGNPVSSSQIAKVLEDWGLAKLAARSDLRVEKFSTGMKRRLGLARVSLSRVPILLLDEPLLGLDQKGIAYFQEVLQRKKTEGTMILVVSHDHEPLRNLVTRTLCLDASQPHAHEVSR